MDPNSQRPVVPVVPVVHAQHTNTQSRDVTKKVVVTADARCPDKPQHDHPAGTGPARHHHVCEPFANSGCSITPDPEPINGCPAGLDFPAVAGHGGCGSAIFSKHGWVHGKCCAGEIGHVGTKTVHPRAQPNMQLRVFDSISQCLATPCPVRAHDQTPPCRCRFPTHVCSTRGPDRCVEAPGYQLNQHASCRPKGNYHLSIETCTSICNLDSDCLGFEVEAANLRKCRLFTAWSRCTVVTNGPHAGGHTFLKPQRHEVDTHGTDRDWITTGIAVVFGVPVVVFLLVVVFLPVETKKSK